MICRSESVLGTRLHTIRTIFSQRFLASVSFRTQVKLGKGNSKIRFFPIVVPTILLLTTKSITYDESIPRVRRDFHAAIVPFPSRNSRAGDVSQKATLGAKVQISVLELFALAFRPNRTSQSQFQPSFARRASKSDLRIQYLGCNSNPGDLF